ncbi:MAG: hypothetical protein ACOZJZ_13175, partial [Pseudomonadota bacterium]
GGTLLRSTITGAPSARARSLGAKLATNGTADASAPAPPTADARGHPLMVHPRVLVTPHIGFNSREALSRIAQTTVDNIAGFLAGRPVNRVG